VMQTANKTDHEADFFCLSYSDSVAPWGRIVECLRSMSLKYYLIGGNTLQKDRKKKKYRFLFSFVFFDKNEPESKCKCDKPNDLSTPSLWENRTWSFCDGAWIRQTFRSNPLAASYTIDGTLSFKNLILSEVHSGFLVKPTVFLFFSCPPCLGTSFCPTALGRMCLPLTRLRACRYLVTLFAAVCDSCWSSKFSGSISHVARASAIAHSLKTFGK
jgi:hypothetical protein